MNRGRTNVIRIDTRRPGANRLHILNTHPRRWSAAAVAAALTLPPDACPTVREWGALIDRLDDGIRAAIYE
jgi:hypothetical protein